MKSKDDIVSELRALELEHRALLSRSAALRAELAALSAPALSLPLLPAKPAPDPVLELEADAEPAPEPAHYFNPREAMAAEAELGELDEALTEPFNPRASMPKPFERPTVAEWQADGYGKELAGVALSEAHKKFFDDYAAELQAKAASADPASGELSPSA